MLLMLVLPMMDAFCLFVNVAAFVKVPYGKPADHCNIVTTCPSHPSLPGRCAAILAIYFCPAKLKMYGILVVLASIASTAEDALY